ncbi:non-ribosomal peptide synthetase [Pseudomonas sp. BJa5]|uniref:non-ribosomal peptide synthetase n=1 Tax=Pseudomonas sp. BJa5 TaxID=2936270 RepID=UPI002559E9C1|nr:non-ribosomal peptide synthetase [Pseudomonas sp. BGr12]MDL2423794.1 amino acid adenylation domain-containing protein [Pseudomonas sp. BGr12]
MHTLDPCLDDDLLALLLAEDDLSPAFAADSTPGPVEPLTGPLPLSFAQQRLWFLQQLEPDGSAYNMPRVLRLDGQMDAQRLERALNRVIERHAILRTRFEQGDLEPQQVIEPHARLVLEQVSLRHLQGQALDDALQQQIAAQAGTPFDLSIAPLIRAVLLETGEQQHYLLLTLHHIVCDAWSNPLLIADLSRAYGLGAEQGLPVPAQQYADYARWQRHSYPQSPQFNASSRYWRDYLGDEIPPLALPQDHPRQSGQRHIAGYHLDQLDPDTCAQLQTLCRAHRLQPMVVLLAAWQLLLGRYSGQSDFTVGIPSATRTRSETQELVGLFVSSQVYRARLSPETTGLELLNRLKADSLAALEHADYPVEQILESLQLHRSSHANPLFQTLFNWRVSSADAVALKLGALEVSVLEGGPRQAKFDLSLEVDYAADAIGVSLEYSTDLFSPATVATMARHWQHLLRALLAEPERRIDELPMLSPGEQQAILRGLNQTEVAYPGEFRVQRLIEQQARRTPEACALVFADRHLSYRQLDQQANRLAHALVRRGVGPEVLVGIAAERSLEMVIGLLAILKAGGAYVPLDPEYPAERLAYMFEDSAIGLLLTQQHLQGSLPPFAGQTLLLDADYSQLPDHAPAVEVDGEHLAYVIYTSGSTGKPKGAGNRHLALHNRLAWMQQAYRLSAADTVLQKTPFSFDVSVWEFFWPLIQGARLVIAAPGEHREPDRLIASIERHQVTTLHFVPSMLQVFIHEPGVERCTSLRRIVCSGEALQADAQYQVFAKLPEAGLYNLYGPTEAAIDVTHWTCRDEGLDSVPIGHPIANLYTHVLDHSFGPVPNGTPGELLLGGCGLARGYHRRPALTAERFIPDPFSPTPGARLYRTGDLARYRADGAIDYCGRIDHQVKIRGLRIELGEIEARLLEQPGLREAAVLAQPGPTGLQLVAYVVGAVDTQISELQSALRVQLPDYMVPAHILLLEQLPLSPNGKLDRRALPMPEVSQGEYVAPRNQREEHLVQLWQTLLRREPIGVTDNFFELGGDSIISIQVVSRARRLGLQLNPRDLFEHQTIESLARVVVEVDQGPLQGASLLQDLRAFARGPQGRAELAYWQALLQGADNELPGAPALCSDHQMTRVQTRLDRHQTLCLLHEAADAYRTQTHELLLSALTLTLCRWTEQADVLIQFQGTGRETRFEAIDLSRSLGNFTCQFPVRLTAAPSLADSIKGTKAHLRAVPNHGLGFGALRYLGDTDSREALAALPVPRVTFDYFDPLDSSVGEPLFIPSDEAPEADAPLGNGLHIKGQVQDGELTLEWQFDQALFTPETIQALADALGEQLHRLIEHCCAPDQGAVTPKDVPLAQLSQAQLDRLIDSPRQLEDLYPLSPMQQGMLFHAQLDGGQGDYLQQLQLDVAGLDIERFKRAWQATLDSHGILRSSFHWGEGLAVPLQRVNRHLSAEFTCHAQGSLDAGQLADQERERGFDLGKAPLLRWSALQQGSDHWHLVFTSHHILLDGWSTSQLFAQLMQRYHGITVPPPRARFRDYIAWLQGRDQQADLNFWQQYLHGQDAPTLLAPQTLNATPGPVEHGCCETLLDATRTRALEQLARSARVTVNTLVQAAWALLLQQYSGQTSVAFGITVAGRPATLAHADEQMGLFINTLPVIVQPRPEQALGQWLQALQADNLRLREHEHSPLFEIQRLFGGVLFDTLLVFENYPVDEALQQQTDDQLQIGAITAHGQTHYPLSVAVGLGQCLDIKLHHRLDRVSVARAEQISAHLLAWLQALSQASAGQALGELAIAHPQPAPALPTAPAACIHELFEQQARRTPEAIALVDDQGQLSYDQLQCQAEQIARYLIDLGLAPQGRVGLALMPSFKRIAALLGILKAGGCYVPLDPSYPTERLQHIIDDSGLTLLVTESAVQDRLPPFAGAVLDIAAVDSAVAETLPAVQRFSSPQQLAYVIYTSGSTGLPKGVAVAHQAVARHCLGAAEAYGLDATDRCLQFASISFDAASEQILMPLLRGASLLVGDTHQWTSQDLADAVERHAVTCLNLPPSYFFETARVLQGQGRCLQVKTCILGGEGWSREHYDKQHGIRCQRLINAYGPTEAVITPLAWHVPLDARGERLAIGTPLGARQAHVLDAMLGQLPAHLSGELYLGGELQAQGYLNQPALTAQRFIPDPFGAPGARLYRTGDLAERGDDALLYYHGRCDQQLKIRGLRMEAGEIEGRLCALPGIHQTLVMRHPQADSLLAYVSFSDNAQLKATDPAVLKRQLGEHLPAYMVPSDIVLLEQWPLTHNGKIDRRRLPLPERVRGAADSTPATALELRMIAVWAQVLELAPEQVGVQDNFFELGGHSLKVLVAVSAIKAELGVELTLHAFIQQPSLRELCAYLEGQGSRRSAIIDLNRSHQPRTLYCLHPGGGSALCYFPLAAALVEQVRVKGLMFHDYVNDPATPRPDWQQMVDDYTRQILADQPEGDVHLLGWSLGAPLAMQIARNLEDQGRTVGFLGLLDPTVEHKGSPAGGAVSEPADSDGQPLRLQALTGFFSLLFVKHAETAGRYCEARGNPLLDDAVVEDFIRWSVSVADISAEQARAVFLNVSTEREVALGKSVYAYLEKLSEDLHYPSLQVPAHCWWSALDTPDFEVRTQALARLNEQRRVAYCRGFDVTHATLAYSPQVIDDICQALA